MSTAAAGNQVAKAPAARLAASTTQGTATTAQRRSRLAATEVVGLKLLFVADYSIHIAYSIGSLKVLL
jgi:hypothetical protein